MFTIATSVLFFCHMDLCYNFCNFNYCNFVMCNCRFTAISPLCVFVFISSV